MIDVSKFERGVCIHYKGAPMMIEAVTFSTPTARGATVIAKTKLRNLLTGQLLSESIRTGDKYPEVDVELRPVTYLYSDGTRWHFMDQASFDQFELGGDELGEATGYVAEGVEGLRARLVEGRVVSIQLPNTVELEVAEADPAVRGATATAVTKRAVLETGLEVQVPLYVERGERVKVDTRDGHFVSRA